MGCAVTATVAPLDEAPAPLALAAWRRLARWPFGRALFAFAVCRKAPYFATIRPAFLALAPGEALVSMRKRRAVTNHIGTIHAIALCNLAELAAGTMTEVTVPRSMRWLPKGMHVEYLAKAPSDVQARATMPMVEPGPAREVPVTVEIHDASGALVCRAVITMWVSPRPQ
jgi:acyl-coenzyme A thioesterase PaaI-like protein